MKKLTLDLNEIRVVSFAADTVPRDRGTVNARETLPESCNSCFPDVCPREKLTTEYWEQCHGG